MFGAAQPPRRLRVLEGCYIQMFSGPYAPLGPGVYTRGENIMAAVFDRLLTDPEFSDRVENLDKIQEEPFGRIIDAPKMSNAERIWREKQAQDETEYRKHWPSGRPTQHTRTR